MAQPPAYNREKNFTLNSGRETDHAALNAELDRASNSVNDIRSNLAILQADDGKLRPSVVTADSISEELRVSLVEGVVMDAQDMLDRSLAAADVSAASADKAGASETKAAASADAAAVSESRAATVAAHVDARADEIVQTASAKAAESARLAQVQANRAAESAGLAEELEKEAEAHASVAGQRGIPIGTIVMFSAPEPPAGYLKADGSLVGRVTYPDLFAAIGTTFGQGDGETTFTLPDLINRFAQGSHTPGQKIGAGLPTYQATLLSRPFGDSGNPGNVWGAGDAAVTKMASGAVVLNGGLGSVSSNVDVTTIDPSLANPVYGASNTVQPPALSLLPCIKAFDAAVNPGLVDVTGLAQEMAGKVNRTETGFMAAQAMPSKRSISLTIGASGTTYTAPASGYFCFTLSGDGTNPVIVNMFVTKPGGLGHMQQAVGTESAIKGFLPVLAGDTVLFQYWNIGSQWSNFYFVYAEGVLP